VATAEGGRGAPLSGAARVPVHRRAGAVLSERGRTQSLRSEPPDPPPPAWTANKSQCKRPPSPWARSPRRMIVLVRHCSPTRRGERAGLTAWSMVANTYTRAAAWQFGSLRVGGCGSLRVGNSDRSALAVADRFALAGADRSALAVADRFALAVADRFALAGADRSALAVADRFALAVADRFALAGADRSALAGADRFALAGADCSALAVADRFALAVTDRSALAVADRFALAGADRSALAVADASPCRVAAGAARGWGGSLGVGLRLAESAADPGGGPARISPGGADRGSGAA